MNEQVNSYDEFLQKKIVSSDSTGFEVSLDDLNPKLFDWQKVVTRWAIYQGRSSLFERPGLGKSFQQLEWAHHINQLTSGDILILAPLAVAQQTVREGRKFDIAVNQCRAQSGVKPGINITNYEMLDHFDASKFTGVVLDESGILKSFMGKTKIKLMDIFSNTPYRLTATATPSPNDHMEILNQADFLGIMPANEALSRWFINDTMHFGNYKLKGHAVKDFWRWVSSWAVSINTPSDIGYPDDGYILPPVNTIEHIVDLGKHDFSNGKLFAEAEKLNATTLYKELRETAGQRTSLAADIVNDSSEGWLVWCNTNIESKLLTQKINDAVELTGSMPVSKKESILKDFGAGNIRIMVSKPSMCGFGLNFQHIYNSISVGINYSFEERYQGLCRIHRFGQKHEVNDHIVLSPAEKQVHRIVKEKAEKYEEMQRNMVANMKDYMDLGQEKRKLTFGYKRKEFSGENWRLIVGDSVQEIKTIPDESVHFQLFSPPFSNLYIYSDSISDMGNCKDDDEFFEQFSYLVPELKRILIPGRLCAVHCKQLVNYKGRDGMAGLRDFRGEIIRLFLDNGWSYHSEVCIWKDPVIEMQRTKSQGLLHKQIKKDSSMSRQGLPDYLVVFRKWPENGETSGPEPVVRPEGFTGYIGEEGPEPIYEGDRKDRFSIHVWQRYASPVWFDIQQTNVLNCRTAREDQDEKHICPLQLDVIKRAIHLWTNPGDTVFTPFGGIGSELYGAIEMGRKALGIELKMAYAKLGARYLSELENKKEQLTLF